MHYHEGVPCPRRLYGAGRHTDHLKDWCLEQRRSQPRQKNALVCWRHVQIATVKKHPKSVSLPWASSPLQVDVEKPFVPAQVGLVNQGDQPMQDPSKVAFAYFSPHLLPLGQRVSAAALHQPSISFKVRHFSGSAQPCDSVTSLAC